MRSDDEIFADALERTGRERDEFLDHACAGDSALRARMDALLAGHDDAGDFLPLPVRSDRGHMADARPGAVIGHYILRERVGEGGCGDVWVADQTTPVKRRIALKLIKLGMDTKEVIARFEAERQALALMEHPNIARVFDGGVTESGRPFFVMEWVRGVPITRHCDEHHLTPGQRIELFMKVCHATHHAHQKGIIHRDLKPSNILVSMDDGEAAPKMIDFGIAKAMQGRLADRTLYTGFGQFIGTPAYMSPEQLGISGGEVDQRTDIYSLGVLLYELLTGDPPFGGKASAGVGPEELRDQIRTSEPLSPSARFRTLTGETRAAIARLRGMVPTQLSGALRGDLDWIVMRCLEKDRGRRYETAHALALDLQRSLHHETITAHPPGGLYVLRKFARRHRLALAAGGAIALALGGAAVAFSVVQRQNGRANRVAADAGGRSTATSSTRRSEARKLADRAAALFEWKDPLTSDVQIAASLCQQAVAMDPNDAEIRAIYSKVLLYDWKMGSRAPQQLAAGRMQAITALNLTPDSFEARLAMANYYRNEQTTLAEAVRRLRELVAENPTHSQALRWLGLALKASGHVEEALSFWDRACARPDGDPLAQDYRASALEKLGRTAEAEAAREQSLALHRSEKILLKKVSEALLQGDVRAAIDALERVPGTALLEPEGAYVAAKARLWNREPFKALQALRAMPQAFVECLAFKGPKDYLNGLALRQAGRPEAANAAWKAARLEVEQRLALEPSSRQLLGWKGVLLARLGDYVEARRALVTFREMPHPRLNEAFVDDLNVRVLATELRMQQRGDALVNLRRLFDYPPARLAYRHDPDWEDLRDQPWLQEVLKAAEAANPSDSRNE